MNWFTKQKQVTEIKPQAEAKKKPIQKLDIAVVGTGHYCVAGNEPCVLFGSVATNMCIAEKNEVLLAPSRNGHGFEPVLTAEIKGLDDLSPGDRMLFLVEKSVSNTMDSVTGELEGNVLVNMHLPADNSERYGNINTEKWIKQLREVDERLGHATFRFTSDNNGATSTFESICNELHENQWQVVLFVGVDSLADTVTHMKLAMENRLMTTNSADGLVLGEGAACLLLQSDNEAGSDVLAYISGIGHNKEPHARKADTKILNGLQLSISAALSQAEVPVEGVKCIVMPGGAETSDHLEWHQVNQKLWPEKLTEEKRLAMQVGEIEAPKIQKLKEREILSFHTLLGEIGAAALPMAIIIGIARLDFEFPKVDQVLVVDAGDFPARGAVCVSAHSTPVQKKNNAA